MSPEWRDVLVALAGALSGGSVFGAVQYAQRRRRSHAPSTPPHECVPSADIAKLTERVDELHDEVKRLRDWRHDQASTEGAARMVPNLMRRVVALRVKVAKLEETLVSIQRRTDT